MYLDLDVSKHLEHKSGEQLKKLDKASDAIWGNSVFLAEDFFPSWLNVFAMLGLGFAVSWPMAVVMLIMVPVYLWIFFYGRRKTDKAQSEIMREFEKFWGNCTDMAANIMSVKSFAREKFHLNKIAKYTTGISRKQEKVSMRWGGLATAVFVLGVINRLVIFSGGIYLVSLNVVSIGTVIMFLSISGYIYGPLMNLGGQLRNLQRQCGYLNAAEDLFNEVNRVLDPAEIGRAHV